ncbi:MAG: hypothetical protein H6739_00295 [Alphaproteobacteria bacterium]|nr:hypothetical protein [Alphaproteobacteria bacterium]
MRPRTWLRRALRAWLTLALTLITVAPAQAARPPDEDRALQLVAQLRIALAAQGEVRGDEVWLRTLLVPAAMPPQPAARAEGYRRLAARLSPGAALRTALDQGGAVAGVVRGPDYLRVVLDGDPTATLVVRREGSTTVIDRVEISACGLCEEPERFVVDLLADVKRQGVASHRLVAGIELWVADAPEDDPDWRAALHRRDTEAGYLAFLLDGAQVLGVSGDRVRVSVRDPDRIGAEEPFRTETWPVIYLDGRWGVHYAELPEDSALRLAPDDIDRWLRDAVISQAAVRYWRPRMIEQGAATLIADDVLFLAPRPVQGDLLLYTQDLRRSRAFVALLDPDSGEVTRRIRMPVLSRQVAVFPAQWRDMFVGALSPSGQLLAIAVHDRLWLVDLPSGRLLTSLRTGPAVTSLAFAPDGRWLAVGDERGSVQLLDVAEAAWGGRYWPKAARTAHALTWENPEQLLVLWEDGELARLRAPDLAEPEPLGVACCGAVRSMALAPSSGVLMVGCAGSCEPAFLWRADLLGAGEPEVLADADYRADAGVIAADPADAWLITPCSREGEGRAALWARGADDATATFSDEPLRLIAWDPDGDAVWVIDQSGRAWRYRLAALTR